MPRGGGQGLTHSVASSQPESWWNSFLTLFCHQSENFPSMEGSSACCLQATDPHRFKKVARAGRI